MSFETFGDFLAMDGHGLYVWLSYGIALAVIAINLTGPMMARKQLISDLLRRFRREGGN